MRTHFPVIAIATFGAGGLLFACTINTTTTPAGDAGTSRTDDGSAAADVGAVDSGEAAAPAPQAYVRIAHWSPDAPALDVCFTEAGGSWAGQLPQLAQIVAASDAGSPGDGGAAGIIFPQVTSYLVIPPGTYSVRLVAAGAADCLTTVVDLTSVTIAANSYTTIAAMGEAVPVATDQPLALSPFADEVSAPAGQIAIRFINASPSPAQSPADLGTGSLAGTGGLFAALFRSVPFGQTGSAAGNDAGAIDASGYIAINPLATATLSAHASVQAVDTTVAVNDVTVTATTGSATAPGAITFTLFIVSSAGAIGALGPQATKQHSATVRFHMKGVNHDPVAGR